MITGPDTEIMALKNSYYILSGELSLNEIFEKNKAEFIAFAHDPDEDVDSEYVGYIISRFEAYELYEYCERLNKIKNEIQRLSGADNKQRLRYFNQGRIPLFVDGSKDREDFDIDGDTPKSNGLESPVRYEKEGNKFSLERLRDLLSKFWNRGN